MKIELIDNTIIDIETDFIYDWDDNIEGTTLDITFKTKTPNTTSQWVSIENVSEFNLAYYFLEKTVDDFAKMTADDFIKDMQLLEGTIAL